MQLPFFFHFLESEYELSFFALISPILFFRKSLLEKVWLRSRLRCSSNATFLRMRTVSTARGRLFQRPV